MIACREQVLEGFSRQGRDGLVVADELIGDRRR
jgi:hypothetical protein